MTWSALAVVYDAMVRESNEGGARIARAKSGLDLGGVFDAFVDIEQPQRVRRRRVSWSALEPTPRAYQRQAVGWMLARERERCAGGGVAREARWGRGR